MVDVFLNSANFATHAFLNLAHPSGYALNLKALIKVPKVSSTSQLPYLDLHLKENLIRQTSFLRKNTPQKPASFKVKPNFETIRNYKKWPKQLSTYLSSPICNMQLYLSCMFVSGIERLLTLYFNFC